MATLASVVKKYRQQGSGVTGALASGIGEKLKERMDPRRLLFKQDGLMTSLFPSLKSFQAKGAGEKSVSGATSELLSSGVGALQPILESIDVNSRISAKNSTVLPMMGRDMNIVRQNMVKLVKLSGGTAATKADAFFMRARDREAAYEAQYAKSKSITKTTPTQEKKDFGFIGNILMSAITPLVGIFSALTATIGSVIEKIAALAGIKTAANIASSFLGGGTLLGGAVGAAAGITAAVGLPTMALLARADEGGTDIANKAMSGGAMGNDSSAIMEAGKYKKEMEDQQAALKDAPWYTRLWGIGASKYLSPLSPSRAGMGDFDLQDYAERVGKLESGNNYAADNHSGYVGKYQFGSSALETFGVLKPGSTKKYGDKGPGAAVYQPDAWANGSLADFLNSPSQQDTLFAKYTKQNLEGLKKAGIISDSSSNNQIGEALYTAHVGGVGGATALYQRGENRQDFVSGQAGSTQASRAKMAASYAGGAPNTTGLNVNTASMAASNKGSAGVNVVNVDNSQTVNGGQGGSIQLSTAEVLDSELGRLLINRAI